MTHPKSNELDEYSRFAVKCVLDRFPHWCDRLKLGDPDGEGFVFADFNMPSPSSGLEHGLWVSTAGEEMTVGLHTHHTHFNNLEAPFDQAHVDCALDHVQDLLDEKIVIVSHYAGDRLVASSAREANEKKPGVPLIRNVTRTTVRSWRGTFDRDSDAMVSSWWQRFFR